MIDNVTVERKLAKVNAIRRLERDLPNISAFQRGQLSGTQQTLYWMCDNGLEPIRAILTDEQIETAEQLAKADLAFLD